MTERTVGLKTAPARKLKKEVAGEEHSLGAPDDAVAQAKLPAHLQHGEAHVDAVEVGNNVEQEEKRHQPPHESGNHGGFQAVGSSFQMSFQ